MTPYGEDGYLMFQGGNVLLSTDGTWTSTAHDAVEGLNWVSQTFIQHLMILQQIGLLPICLVC